MRKQKAKMEHPPAKWWRHPNMILLYGFMGATAGVLIGPVYFVVQMRLLQYELQASYHGFVTLLDELVIVSGAIMGAISGCGIVHSFGKYRHVAGVGLIVCSIIAALVMLALGIPFAQMEGRRMALAVYGVGFVWSLQLFLWGSYILLEAKRQRIKQLRTSKSP